jgi:hypothetical protein
MFSDLNLWAQHLVSNWACAANKAAVGILLYAAAGVSLSPEWR